jgi:hypothetical protein
MTKSVSNLARALAAVVLGNAVYFLLMPHLPAGVRHVPFRLDAGLGLDFVICLAAFGVIKAFF